MPFPVPRHGVSPPGEPAKTFALTFSDRERPNRSFPIQAQRGRTQPIRSQSHNGFWHQAIRHTDSILKITELAPTRKMRMKFNKPIQLLAISAASLLAASFLSACSTLTVDFVYVTSAKAAGPNNYGEVNVYEINSESGRMRQIVTSPFPSGGRNPVAEAVSPDEADLYVVNRDDNSIVQFVIGSDGKLYPQNTVNTPGIFPAGCQRCGKFPLRG